MAGNALTAACLYQGEGEENEMSDAPTLTRFDYGWAEDGTGPDGFPLFRETVVITLSRPPYLKIEREADEADFEEYEGPYKLFLKQSAAAKPDGSVEGYPLAYWPVVTPAELKMCSARDILTVQQLATYAKRRDAMPPQIIELAKRAAKMVEMQNKVGKFEATIKQLTDERDLVNEQLIEARNTISAQNSIISTLKMKVA